MKKLIALVLALTMVLALCACGSTAKSDTYKVGVCQLVQHVALDSATQGFVDALKEALGDKVEVNVQNASGEPANCATIVNGFVSDKYDLIMANATPALQAAAQATSDIPVLGTSITDYAGALGITDWNGTVGGNVSGTSDLAPLSEQAAMVKELFPEAKTVGLLYCTAEANSVYQCTVIDGYLKELGLEVTWFGFSDTNDVASVTESACVCDVVYIPTDNTAASNAEAIANVLVPAGVPAVCGEQGIASGCGVATLSINYYDIGYITGQMAAKILKGEAKVSEMPIENAPEVTKMYNADICAKLGVTIPEDYTVIG